jgi:hypothetical protein
VADPGRRLETEALGGQLARGQRVDLARQTDQGPPATHGRKYEREAAATLRQGAGRRAFSRRDPEPDDLTTPVMGSAA